MFEILSLIASFAVIAAFKKIWEEHKRRKEAEENWKKFQERNSNKKDKI